jgi:AraC-like DNA-binding protein
MVKPQTPGMLVWPAAMIVWGPGFTAARHRHHCVQLVATTDGSLRIRQGPEDKWRRCGAALVRPDAIHEIDARGATLLIGFIDAESELGVALRETIDGDISSVGARKLARWRAAWGPRLSATCVERWVRGDLLLRRRPVRIHPGVARAIGYLREGLEGKEDLSLEAVAALAGLSPSRFMHVFTQSVGVPLRPYILWLRLQRAACDLMSGANATEAAHNAGFADAAHLTRTFRRMLGVTPTDLELRKRMSYGASMPRATISEGARVDAAAMRS